VRQLADDMFSNSVIEDVVSITVAASTHSTGSVQTGSATEVAV
jgi:hypothetical protein